MKKIEIDEVVKIVSKLRDESFEEAKSALEKGENYDAFAVMNLAYSIVLNKIEEATKAIPITNEKRKKSNL